MSGRVDALAKENSDLSAENEKLKAQIPHKKAAKSSKKQIGSATQQQLGRDFNCKRLARSGRIELAVTMSYSTEPVFLEPLPPLPEPPPPRRSTGAWILGILLGATLAVDFDWRVRLDDDGARAVCMCSPRLREGTKTTTQINVDQPTVVRQIQQLQRLETVNYSMDKIISGEHSNPYLPKFLVGDRLLLVMHGEVIAGFRSGRVCLRGCDGGGR